MPKISIHMITYNRAHYIKQAIDSVLSQTFQDWELLILDDCSTDNTYEIICPYLTDTRIKYIKNEHNLGIAKNRNKALSLSTGEYVAVLDSDDYWIDTNKLEQQIQFLDTHKEYALVGTGMIIIDDTKTLKKIIYPSSNTVLRYSLLLKNFFCHSSVLYRRKKIIDLGSYDESLPIWEDYDLWLKVGLKYKFANLNLYGTAYRKHGSQSNAEKIKIGKDTQSFIIKKYKDLYPGYMLAKIIDTLR